MSLTININILRFRYHVQFWNAMQIQCFEAVFFLQKAGGLWLFYSIYNLIDKNSEDIGKMFNFKTIWIYFSFK